MIGRGGVLVSLGGDIATGGTAPDGGWRVLRSEDHATPAESDGEVFRVAHGALATSSTTLRRWTRGGIERHHLLDPVTGLPAAGPWRTATVVATTCADANAAARARPRPHPPGIRPGSRAPKNTRRHAPHRHAPADGKTHISASPDRKAPAPSMAP